jgi:hypothetical protein
MVDRETAAWDMRYSTALVDLFHPDMVWPWPPDSDAHDPALWVFPQGRFNRERWKAGWEDLFETHELVWNRRRTVRIDDHRSPICQLGLASHVLFGWDNARF